ncbi:cupin domain-containing protein [Comamonas testosteroni]|uniref:cupin domain-containing protein n=1 Tax=Comamonas testosteroni TaxID=285 RepID=UPI0015F9F289|nr:cupin domain-containing protein [Comamonas testosteroni]
MARKSYDAVVFDAKKSSWESWSKPGANGRVKIFNSNGKRLRLLELPAGFDEQHWCLIGHQGYVLEGCFTIIFDDASFDCCPGMAFSIPDGVRHRSKGTQEGRTLVFVVDTTAQALIDIN